MDIHAGISPQLLGSPLELLGPTCTWMATPGSPPATFRPHMFVDAPPTSHPPSSFPDISALTGVPSVSWLLRQLLGCTPRAYKPCTCPASRLKKGPRVGDRAINDLMDEGLTRLKRGPEATPHRVPQIRGRTGLQASLPEGREGYRGN